MAWLVELNDRSQGTAASRKAAMNVVDKPYRFGKARIFNDVTGEEWERRTGTWCKTAEKSKRKERAA